jgi:hypothetical protein
MGCISIVGIITKRLLFCSTQLEYVQKLEIAQLEIGLLLSDNQLPEYQLDKFNSIFEDPGTCKK